MADGSRRGVVCELIDPSNYDTEDLEEETAVCVFVAATYEGGKPPKNGEWFCQWASDSAK